LQTDWGNNGQGEGKMIDYSVDPRAIFNWSRRDGETNLIKLPDNMHLLFWSTKSGDPSEFVKECTTQDIEDNDLYTVGYVNADEAHENVLEDLPERERGEDESDTPTKSQEKHNLKTPERGNNIQHPLPRLPGGLYERARRLQVPLRPRRLHQVLYKGSPSQMETLLRLQGEPNDTASALAVLARSPGGGRREFAATGVHLR